MSGADTAARLRIVIAKPGLDGHDRGAKIIARSLRDAGMEVIYTGLHQRPEQIVATALQEDADAIGLSILSGAHLDLTEELFRRLEQEDARDVVVVLGGVIPARDHARLHELGVAEIFTPGASMRDIAERVRGAIARRRSSSELEARP